MQMARVETAASVGSGGHVTGGSPLAPGLPLVCAVDAFHVTWAIILAAPSSLRVTHWGH